MTIFKSVHQVAEGSRVIAEVEVGGWPFPEITWYRDDEILISKVQYRNSFRIFKDKKKSLSASRKDDGVTTSALG